jgi:hypothetical protein
MHYSEILLQQHGICEAMKSIIHDRNMTIWKGDVTYYMLLSS